MLTMFPLGDVTVNVTSSLVLVVCPVIPIVSDPSTALAVMDKPLSSAAATSVTASVSVIRLESLADVSADTPPFTSIDNSLH